jgi:hypothetical protein
MNLIGPGAGTRRLRYCQSKHSMLVGFGYADIGDSNVSQARDFPTITNIYKNVLRQREKWRIK